MKNLASILESAFPSFPTSHSEPTMLYNYSKIIYILRDKELASVCQDSKVLEEADNISQQFSHLLPLMNSDLDEGLIKYEEIKHLMTNKFTGLLHIFVKQWGVALKALYYYRKNKLNAALALTLECIILNDHLIENKFYTNILRNAEQNRNYARVLVAMGKKKEGAEHAVAVVDYLLNGNSTVLQGTAFKNPSYWEKNVYIREGYAYECFRGLVHNLIVFKGNHEERKELFASYFNNFHLELTTPDRVIISNWLELKKSLLTDNVLVFIENFITYMKEPIYRIYDILKISLLQDVEEILFTHKYFSKQLLVLIHSFAKDNLLDYDGLKSYLFCFKHFRSIEFVEAS